MDGKPDGGEAGAIKEKLMCYGHFVVKLVVIRRKF